MMRCIFLTAMALLMSGGSTSQVLAQEPKNNKPVSKWQEPLTGMTFVALPAGCYQMGDPDALNPRLDQQLRDAGYTNSRFADEAPVHQVCVEAFWIGRYEVQAKQWLQTMGTAAPKGEGKTPAAAVSWLQAQAFAQQLTNQNKGRFKFRLPTEAEWEYACRAGVTNEARAVFDNERLDSAWYSVKHRRNNAPSETGLLNPNGWGLNDMLGNVWEWTEDNYSPSAYRLHTYRNPKLINDSTEYVIRGGSFRSNIEDIHCTSRSRYPKNQALEQIGFRLVRSIVP